MKLIHIFKLSITLLHTILFFSVLLFTLLSRNVDLLMTFLIIMISVKFVFYLYKRCILTFLEEDSPFATASEMFGAMITKKKLDKGTIEEIAINTGVLLLFAKIFFLISIKQNFNYFPIIIKNFISTYLYNVF
jgi:hypothetical protein